MKPTDADVDQILELIRKRRELIDAEQAAAGNAGGLRRGSFTVEEIMKADERSPELESVYGKAREIAERLGADGMEDMVEAMWDRDPQGRGLSALEQLWTGIHGWVP